MCALALGQVANTHVHGIIFIYKWMHYKSMLSNLSCAPGAAQKHCYSSDFLSHSPSGLVQVFCNSDWIHSQNPLQQMAPSLEAPQCSSHPSKTFLVCLGFIAFHPFEVLGLKISLFNPPVLFQSFPRSLFLLASLQECCLAKILCFLCSIDFLAVGTMVLMTLGSV